MPDGWNAGDLAGIEGQLILAQWAGRSDADDGLYRFDTSSGDLVRQLAVADASTIVGPTSRREAGAGPPFL